MGLRDRILTRRVSQRMMSPAAIVAAGAGSAVVVAAGAPLVLAAAAGVAAWGLVVGTAVERGAKRPSFDARSLPPPWRDYVREAQDAASRYDRALSGVQEGPVRVRLLAIGERVRDGVEQCWHIANRGLALDRAAMSLEDPRRVRDRLDDLTGREDATAQQTRAALQAQLDATERLARTRRDVGEQLQLLDARLDESVARAVELGLSADRGDVGLAGTIGSDIEAVVQDMEALRQALEETTALG
ncbi:MAG: hypothetical protein WEB03_14245 [Nitriliruptor sp.]|uniref:hypothetical protein n=1 Tax=Nitriliruptor sp. TaxID=2448056 RepID=UPI00349FEF6B